MGRRPARKVAAERDQVCGRLVQNEPYGVVDMCGEQLHHDRTGPQTPHQGRYHGVKWLTPYSDNPHATAAERSKVRIIDPGDIMGAANRDELAPPAPPKHERHRQPPAPGRRMTA